MIVINRLHGGQFGNKLLHYYNLLQVAYEAGTLWDSVPYSEYTSLGLKNTFNGKAERININDLSGDISFLNERCYSLEPCLGEAVFKYNNDIRSEFNVPDTGFDRQYDNIGVHFRGGDFHTWNPDSILSTDYYISCIEDCVSDNSFFYLFTDDKNLDSYKNVERYLSEKKIPYKKGEATENKNKHFLCDYYQLYNTDTMISSPSTFAISAWLIGDFKKCYHSEKWINSRISKGDKFWCDVREKNIIII